MSRLSNTQQESALTYGQPNLTSGDLLAPEMRVWITSATRARDFHRKQFCHARSGVAAAQGIRAAGAVSKGLTPCPSCWGADWADVMHAAHRIWHSLPGAPAHRVKSDEGFCTVLEGESRAARGSEVDSAQGVDA